MFDRLVSRVLLRCRRVLASGPARALSIALLSCATAVPLSASAADGRGGRMARPPMLRAAPFGPRMMRPDRVGPPLRQMREQPIPQAVPVERPVEQFPQGRPGRLTPDERRALRQQINDAGRDIYRAPRP
jgi:hypothetical protein